MKNGGAKAFRLSERHHSISGGDLLRPSAVGKFLFNSGKKILIKGVSYGTFRPDEHGNEFRDRGRVKRDFALISAHGMNAVRTYTAPPRWLLDLACQHRLRVMVGLPWEQHVAFLDDKSRSRDIRKRVRAAVRLLAGHPAVLCFAIGNEIPAPIVRWYGARRIEQFLRALYADAKEEDSEALFTYVNYPSTEYLELDFLDLVSFNVYLETQEKLTAYVARLQNLVGNRPLLLTELGLDSLRHGEQAQAQVLDWQVRTAFAEGSAGAILFSWTDEWYRGGHDILDWAFGLTDCRRRPKPALAAVTRAFSEVPFAVDEGWPSISVIVCSYNGERTIRQCLDGLLRLNYPKYDVIVVDDGSTDATAEIARKYPFRIIRTENQGLSTARNTGLQAATGEIVAYIDDDAYPDPDWLNYLAVTFRTTDHVGVGGPNIPPPGDGLIADCVAVAPGGPTRVLVSDREAEHIPGCNMAFRKSCLESIGGFDAKFRVAGDDVDVCWRLQERGWSLGFSPAAVVWHHRRNSVKSYWRQQKAYGKAEALLEAKWPERYNTAGHPTWAGRIYVPGISRTARGVRRISHGVWGSALFQSVYELVPKKRSSAPMARCGSSAYDRAATTQNSWGSRDNHRFRCSVSAFQQTMRTSVQIELTGASQLMKERRSSARIDAPYPARLRGVDVNDQPFKEEIVLQNLSAGGSYLRLKRMVREGAEVSLAVRLSTAGSTDGPVLRFAAGGTVLRVVPQWAGSYGVAVEFLRRHIF